jgi:hypothetical protein
MSIVVDPIDCQMVGVATCPSPIAKECIFPPFVAKPDATTAITRKCLAMRVCASRFHVGPNPMQSGEAFTVLGLHLCAKRRFPTAARFDTTFAQQFSARENFSATCTSAMPKHSPICIATGSAQRSQSTKRLVGDINEFGQGDLLARLLCQVTGWRFNAGPLRILARATS